jgi:hypothetical protein
MFLDDFGDFGVGYGLVGREENRKGKGREEENLCAYPLHDVAELRLSSSFMCYVLCVPFSFMAST